MKIIALLGSPRVGGNTDTLAAEAIRGAGSRVEVFRANEMNISPCQNCGGCDATGICVVEDDMAAVHGAIRSADRIILASPIFFMGLSAQIKAVIDRCQAIWCEKHLLHKTIAPGPHGRKGLLLLVGGMKRDAGIKCAETCATAFFRTVSVPEHETLSYTGVDAKGDILKHPSALREAFDAGRRLLL